MLDAVQQEEREQVAVLERRDPVDVVRQQRLPDAERRQRDQHVVDARVGTVQLEGRPQLRLQLVEAVVSAVHGPLSVGVIRVARPGETPSARWRGFSCATT